LNIFSKYVPLIDRQLQEILFQREPASLYEPCRYILKNGGKRIRPILTLLGAGICGRDEAVKKAVPAALAVELIHNFTLVHDDIMDEADSRRGKPSVHAKWDIPTAILVGDLLHTEAFQQLNAYGSESKVSREQFTALYQTLLNSIKTVCEGQAMDMEFEDSKEIYTDLYLKMIEGKTSALLSGSLSMGGIVGSGSNEQIGQLRQVGNQMGLAFQIQDDLLDVVADPEKFGKIQGGDIREGKKTYLLLLAFELSNEIQKKELHRLSQQNYLTDTDVERVIEIYEQTGTIRKTEEKVSAYYQNVLDLLNSFEDSTFKTDLVSLINFLKNRDY
jgi:geranylgeranyl diphosphate synthase, type II